MSTQVGADTVRSTTKEVAPAAQRRSPAAEILLATLPFGFVLLGYAFAGSLNGAFQGVYAQGALNDLGFGLHVIEPVTADRWLFGQLPTAWLQEHLYVPGRVQWYDAVVALVYVSHYVAAPGVAVVLWLRHRERFLAFVGCALGLAVLGLVTYITYPMAPPWVAAETGVIDPISRISNIGWEYLGLGPVGGLLSFGQSVSNEVAAMPSMHVGYAALCAAFFVTRAAPGRSLLLVGYPVLMGVAVVYAGEHYVVDVLLGMAFAVLVVACCRLLLAYRQPA